MQDTLEPTEYHAQSALPVHIKWDRVPEPVKVALLSRLLWLAAQHQQPVSATQGTQGQMEEHVLCAMVVRTKWGRIPVLVKGVPLSRPLRLEVMP